MLKGMANSGPAPAGICATEAFQENRNISLRYHVWDDRKTLRLDFYLVHRESPVLGANAQVSHMTYQMGLASAIFGQSNTFLNPAVQVLAENRHCVLKSWLGLH
jgi:hypothetical protein